MSKQSLDSASRKFPSLGSALALCGLLALVLRLVNVISTMPVPTSELPLGDAQGYLEWGRRISGGDWYGKEAFYQAPLYPYFLGLVMAIFGDSITIIRLLQAFLGATGVVLLGRAVSRWFDSQTAIVCAAGLALYPAAIYYDGIIQKASMGCFLLCLLLYWLSRLHQSRSWRVVGVLGITAGLLALTRENALLWVPVLGAYLMIRTGNEMPLRSRVTEATVFLLGVGLVLFPVAARNASLGGNWSPTTVQAGPNFYIGNNLQSNGLYRPLVPGHETPAYERADARQLAQQAMGTELSDKQVSRFWFDKSFQEIAANPVRWIQLLCAKFLITIHWFEVPDVESATVYSQYSPVLRVLFSVWHFGWLFPWFALGIVFAKRREFPWILVVLAVTMVFAVAAFFLLGRYRFPLVPLLMPIAAFAIVQSWCCLTERRWIGWAGGCVFMIAVLLARLPVVDVAGLNGTSLMNAGVSLGQLGRIPEAIELFRDAVKRSPSIAEPHQNLGRAYLLQGRNQAALNELLIAKQINPSLAFLDRHLGEAYAKLGNLDTALRFYNLAIDRDPADSSARSMVFQLEQALEQQKR